jgi:hypothetical protein
LEPFCAAGALAGGLAGWGWDDVGAPPQAHVAALESLAAGAAVAGIGVFAGSLIIIIRYCLLAAMVRSQEAFSQETCQPDFAGGKGRQGIVL